MNGTLEQVEIVAREVAAENEEIKQRAREMATAAKAWQTLGDALRDGHILRARELVHTQEETLLRGPSSVDPVIVGNLKSVLDEQGKAIIKDYPRLMQAAAESAGVSIDATSRHPHYKFHDGYFVASIKDSSGRASLVNHEGKIDRPFPADPAAVLAAVQREEARVFGRKLNASVFLKALRQAYLAAAKDSSTEDGGSVLLDDVYHRFTARRKKVRPDEFYADLADLLSSGEAVVDGRRPVLEQTKDTSKGHFLPGHESSGMVGFIAFKEVRK